MNDFIRSYNLLENTYMKYKNSVLPMDDDAFSDAFFSCFDYLSSFSSEEINMLKTDLNLHCKIVMFDTIKLHILSQNPQLLKVPGFYKIF